jgi:hypothetical protein
MAFWLAGFGKKEEFFLNSSIDELLEIYKITIVNS